MEICMNESRKKLTQSPISCFADEIAVSLERQIAVLQELGIKIGRAHV